MQQLEKVDRALISTILTVLIMTIGIYFWDKDYFALRYAVEDGPVEYGTALFLFVASLVLFRNALSFSKTARLGAVLLMALYGLMFFFASGEEISWGQRIFGWETSELMREINNQNETNLHNIIVWGKPLSKTLFGSGLTVVLLFYLVVLPLLYARFGWVSRLADRIFLPVPGGRHAILAVLASLVIAAIDVPRKWEVYELIFSLLAVSIFLLPQNRNTFPGVFNPAR